MSEPSFVVYIDESGDEGFAFETPGKGSSRWFVLSAVVTRKRNDMAVVKLIDDLRTRLGRPERYAFHFRRMKHTHRLVYIDSIASAQLRTITVLVHKPSLLKAETFQGRYKLYFYTTRFLLERVSWFCRDKHSAEHGGDGSARIFFSNRAGMSYVELRDYLMLLKDKTKSTDVRIDWNVVRPDRIRALAHQQMMGLQIADAVATAFYMGIQPDSYGFTEPRYAQMLKQVVYRHKRDYLSYGVKFWPPTAIEVIKRTPQTQWVDEVYA